MNQKGLEIDSSHGSQGILQCAPRLEASLWPSPHARCRLLMSPEPFSGSGLRGQLLWEVSDSPSAHAVRLPLRPKSLERASMPEPREDGLETASFSFVRFVIVIAASRGWELSSGSCKTELHPTLKAI